MPAESARVVKSISDQRQRMFLAPTSLARLPIVSRARGDTLLARRGRALLDVSAGTLSKRASLIAS
jgi:4-aminobutyrate aminotransferase-like enzyme